MTCDGEVFAQYAIGSEYILIPTRLRGELRRLYRLLPHLWLGRLTDSVGVRDGEGWRFAEPVNTCSTAESVLELDGAVTRA
jgi:hypothetical protein